MTCRPLANPLAIGDGRCHLRHHPLGLAYIGGMVGRRRIDIRVEMGQHAHRAAQHVHGMNVRRNSREQLDERFWNRASGPETPLELLELPAIGQVAVEQQKRCLLIRNVACQILDRVAPVLEPSGPVLPLDVGDCRLVCNDPFQAGRIMIRRNNAHFETPNDRTSQQDDGRTMTTSFYIPPPRAATLPEAI